MSQDGMVWSIKDAPTRNPYEHSVLSVMADEAGEDGCGVFLSVPTIAERAKMSEREVRDCLKSLLERRLVGYGDQSLAAYIRADRRPMVYDLLIPYDWYGSADRVNQNRLRKDLPPLSPHPCGEEACADRVSTEVGPRCGHRPPIAPAPARRRRSDLGQKRGKSGGMIGSPPAAHGVTDSPPGLIGRHGVNTKSVDPDLSSQVNPEMAPPRGVYQSPDPLTQRTNPSSPLPPEINSRWSSPQTEEGGAVEGSQPTPQDMTLAAAALAMAPHWRRSVLLEILADPDITHRTPEVVERAVLAVAGGDHGYTASPRRLLEPGPWWADACGVDRTPRQAEAETGPSPSQLRRDCPACDPAGWLLEPSDLSGRDVVTPLVHCDHRALVGVG